MIDTENNKEDGYGNLSVCNEYPMKLRREQCKAGSVREKIKMRAMILTEPRSREIRGGGLILTKGNGGNFSENMKWILQGDVEEEE